MRSAKQDELINMKVSIVVKEFLRSKGYIEEVSERTGIPPSSVQRYLNSDRVTMLFGPQIHNIIQEQLKLNKQEGLKKGGIVSISSNEVIKDDIGHFQGVRKK